MCIPKQAYGGLRTHPTGLESIVSMGNQLPILQDFAVLRFLVRYSAVQIAAAVGGASPTLRLRDDRYSNSA